MPSYSDFVRDDGAYSRPIRGATVRLFAIDGTTLIDTDTTGADGQFTVTGPDAKCVLQVSYGGASERSTVIIGNPPEYTGATGPSNNTRLTLAALKAAAVTDKTSLYDGSLWTWTLGNYMGRADDVNIVKAGGEFLFTGAWVRQLSDQVYLDNFGAKGDGVTDDGPALALAVAAGLRVLGSPGRVYLLSTTTTAPDGRKIVGNGASMKIAPGAIGIKLPGRKCEVSGWTMIGNGGLYAVQDTGKFNVFKDNELTGNIGHFYFCSDAIHPKAKDNTIDGRSADVEITTALAFERSRHISIIDNKSEDIPIGWFAQVRDSSFGITISNNNTKQTQYRDTKVATEGQKVFAFTLSDQLGYQSPCFLRKIQINGLPLSTGYTVVGNGPSYMVTFSVGRQGGVAVSLVGYRGAENIQVNTGSSHGTISVNTVNGTADSGIIIHGSNFTVSGNTISNCGYVGIAIYGDQNNNSVTGNTISDCAQMDDGMSSPDFPDLPSVFAGAILLSGTNCTATGNTITNSTVIGGRGSMRYGIRFNKSDMPLHTDGTAAMTASGNTFNGVFVDGHYSAPQDTTGQRVKSISVDGALVNYPSQIDLNQRWGVPAPTPEEEPNYPAYPPSTDDFQVGGSSGTRIMRDQAVKRGGTASMRTVPNQYIDFELLSASMLYDTNVNITFWAKSNGGRSYFTVFTELAGLLAPITAIVDDLNWRQYTITFPLVPNLAPRILLRIGAELLNTGGPESANFQHIQITGRRL